MGFAGLALGAWIGSLFGGPLGALLGAVAGNVVEKKVRAAKAENRFEGISAEKRAMIFTASAAAILAKMAKADGVVSSEEIACVERVFARLGFDRQSRNYAVNVFRRAKDDGHSIYEYAAEFAKAVESVEVRELFYGLLWDLACADGKVTPNELSILQRIPLMLQIRMGWFELYRRERLHTSGAARQGHGDDGLSEAYATLGVSASSSDDAIKKAYRDLAKRHHPDLLRAQGLPEELVGRATEKMSRINAAWERIKGVRGL